MPWSVSESYIDEAERKLGVESLPTSYRQHIANQNGGSLYLRDDVWELLPVWDTSTDKRASRTSNDLVRETIRLRALDWFPKGAIAIALCNQDRLVLIRNEGGQVLDECFLWHFSSGELEQVSESCGELFELRER